MFPYLTHVEAPEKYKLRLRFDDGTQGVIDLSALAGKGVFSAWDDDNLFLHPFISVTGAIAWNEWLDIDSNNAYLMLKRMTFDEWKQNKLLHASD
ncbi:hypothetical protein GCM10027341_37710 [Spirosoma knui]